VLVFAALDFGGWARQAPEARLALRAAWILMYVAVALRLARLAAPSPPGRPALGAALPLLRRHWMLAALLALTILSTAWSLAPLETLRLSLSLAGTTLLGAYIGCALPPRLLDRALGAALLTMIIASLLSLAWLPESIVVEPLTGKWRGLTNHKNSLAALAAIGALYFAAAACRRRAWTSWKGAACAVCLLAVLLPRSVTALLALAAGAVALGWLALARRWRLGAPAAVIVLLAALGFAALVAGLALGPLTAALGKDPTLNGRIPLWRTSVQIVRERPLTGYGYGAVWGRGRDTLLPHLPRTGHRSATSAHNAFLQAATETGLSSALLLVALFCATLARAAAWHERQGSPFSLFVLAYLVAFGTMNLAEAHLLRVHSVFWIQFVALAVMLKSARCDPRPS